MPPQTKSNNMTNVEYVKYDWQFLLHTNANNKNACKLAYRNRCFKNGFLTQCVRFLMEFNH